MDVDKYKEYQGAWVKNAYDPQFTVDGKYDEKAAQAAESLDIALCMMMKAGKKAFKIEKTVHKMCIRDRSNADVTNKGIFE